LRQTAHSTPELLWSSLRGCLDLASSGSTQRSLTYVRDDRGCVGSVHLHVLHRNKALRHLMRDIPTEGAEHLMRHQYWVYILASKTGVLYVGVTNDIERRIVEHKSKRADAFTARYNVTRLVYCEEFRYINDAIAREKEIKGWRREKKVRLIDAENPRWIDLSAEWYAPNMDTR
jgi:putative endonuclease